MTDQLHVFISGRVQGVSFRDATRRRAMKSGVTGWVRNLDDGRVEAVFQGDPDATHALADWCGKGPVHAEVDEVIVKREPAETAYDSFEIRF